MSSVKDNIIIGIDTSCYTTSIAAISLDRKVIFNERIILEVDKNSKGLRQSEAVFQHVKNLGVIGDSIKQLTQNYNIVAICVSDRPRPVKDSYMPVFKVGENFAKLTGSMIGVPIYITTHQENHIEASLYTNTMKNSDKFLSVHMSGGTTEILLVNKSHETNEDIEGLYSIDIVGGSKDISFGQLIDRIGVSLGYKFPSGKYIDENAMNCELKIDQGLKTSVIEGYMNISGLENQIYRISESKEYISKLTLDSIVRSMYKSVVYLSTKYNLSEVLFAGGVSASKYINRELTKKLKQKNITAYFTEPQYSTDNAIGCAIIGLNKFIEQKKS